MEKFDLREYAVRGAEQRLLEIAEEAARIFAAFPELREPGRGFDAVRGSGRSGIKSSVPKTVRRRRKMSAAGKRRISEAAKKRWVEWRKKKEGA